MPVNSLRHRFTTWQIAGVPQERGVYVLWDGDEAIYVGATRGDASVRSCLQEHYARRARPHDATHFSWEMCADPLRREAELLAEFRIANSRLPRCNEGGK
jgi:hypothetical protein